METKKCSKCGQTKPVDDFYKRKDTKDGLNYQCKTCRHEAKIRYNNTNRDKIKQYNEKYYLINKKDVIDRVAIYKENNRDKVLTSKKNHHLKIKDCVVKFEAYSNKLTKDESPKPSKDGVSLEVKCRYCGKYFIPTNKEVQIRLRSLNHVNKGDGFLYCSEHCKEACPVYGQLKYPKGFKIATSREVQPELRQLTLARDNYTCQKCGNTIEEVQLHCHHILPINESPVESADVSNCITLCKECHQHAHAIPDCSYHELKCSV